jgi:hypothetical protein
MEREMSKETWNKLDHLIANIRQRAARSKDNKTYDEADLASALLRNLAAEIQMEDDRGESGRGVMS